jgi:hypothetical protein
LVDNLRLLLDEIDHMRMARSDAVDCVEIREGSLTAGRFPRKAVPCLFVETPYKAGFRSIPAGS